MNFKDIVKSKILSSTRPKQYFWNIRIIIERGEHTNTVTKTFRDPLSNPAQVIITTQNPSALERWVRVNEPVWRNYAFNELARNY